MCLPVSLERYCINPKMRCFSKLPPFILAFFFLLPFPSYAGGPLLVSRSGDPFLWGNTSSIPYFTDQGGLGSFDNQAALALIAEAFSAWDSSSISTVKLSFSRSGSLGGDIDTLAEYENLVLDCDDSTNAIIFDQDGAIIEALFGVSKKTEVIGFAGITCITTNPPFRITKGSALLNGLFINGDSDDGAEITQEEFKSTIVHELGHFLNLDHTQVNGHFFLGDKDDPGFEAYRSAGDPPATSMQLMFPFLIVGLAQPANPLMDDIAAISTLYPSSSFSSSTGSISGNIYLSNGVTPFQGGNVIARNVNDPYTSAVSNVSGANYCPTCTGTGTAPLVLKGAYEINGLVLDQTYSVEIVNINSQFTAESGVGPLPIPVQLPGREEFYSGEDESADDVSSTPTTITVSNTVSNVNIILNGTSSAGSGNADDFGEGGGSSSGGGGVIPDLFGSDRGCFIATAAYGSPLEKEVELLRLFRDQVMINLPLGSSIIELYYEFSPPIARIISKSETLKGITQMMLLPLIGLSWLILIATHFQQIGILLAMFLIPITFRNIYRKGRLGKEMDR